MLTQEQGLDLLFKTVQLLLLLYISILLWKITLYQEQTVWYLEDRANEEIIINLE